MASRFWKGGGSSTNWSAVTPTNWAATTGGANNATVPGVGDDVFFDASSVSPAVLDTNFTINSLDCTGYAGTLTHTAAMTLTIAGNGVVFKLSAGMTYTLGNAATSALTFTGTSGTTVLTSNGKTLGNVTFIGVGGTWQLADAMVTSSAATVILTKGTLDTNSKACTWGGFTSNLNNIRVLTLGSSAMLINSPIGWTVTVANLTLTANTAVLTFSGTSAGFTDRNNHAYYDVVFSGSGNPGIDLETGSSCRNLTINGAGIGGITFRRNATAIITGVLTIAGADESHRVIIYSGGAGFLGVTATVQVGGSVALQYADIQDIAATGAAGTWTGTRLGDAGGNSGITFDAPRTLFWVGNSPGAVWTDTTHWATTSGGTSGALRPLAQDSVKFDALSFTLAGQTVTMATLGYIGSVDFTGVTNNPTLANASNNPMICGSLTLVSGMTLSGSAGLSFGGRSACALTSAGKTFAMPVTVDAPGGTLTMQDALTQTGTFVLNSGTFDTGGFSWTAVSFVAGGSVAKALLLRASTVTFTGATPPWTAQSSAAGGFTVTPGTSTVIFNNASATAHTISWGGVVFNNVQITGAGTGVWTLNGAGLAITFNDFRIDTPPHTVKVQNGSTLLVQTFTVNGTPGNIMTLQSAAAGVEWSLFVVSLTDVSCDEVSLQDSAARAIGGFNSTYAATVLLDAPAGFWRLNGNVTDSASSPHNATNIGAATFGAVGPITGDGSTAATLDNTGNQYFTLPLASSLAAGATFSLETWFYTTGRSVVSDTTNSGIFFDTSNANSILLQNDAARINVSMGTNALTSRYSPAVGYWHHLVYTSDGVNHTLYTDGILDKTAAVSGTLPSFNHTSRLGHAGSATYPLYGRLANAAVYTFALSAAQVATHYAAGPKLNTTRSTLVSGNTGWNQVAYLLAFALPVNQAQSAAVSRAISETKSVTATTTGAVARLAGVMRSAATVITGVRRLAAAKALSVATAATATFSRVGAYLRTLTSVMGSSVTRRTAVQRLVAGIATLTAAVVNTRALALALAAVATVTATVGKAGRAIRSASVSLVSAFTSARIAMLSLSAALATTVTRNMAVQRVIAAVVTTAASITRLSGHFVALVATVTLTAARQVATAVSFGTAQVLDSALSKRFGRLLSAALSLVAASVIGLAILRIVSLVGSQLTRFATFASSELGAIFGSGTAPTLTGDADRQPVRGDAGTTIQITGRE